MQQQASCQDYSLSPKKSQKSVVTVGLFDGVHIGHRALIEELKKWAAEEGAISVVVTFDQHPSKILTGKAPPLIDPPHFRVELIKSLGVTKVELLKISKELLSMTAEEFLREFVAKELKAIGILVGFNNRFGSDQADYERLKHLTTGLSVKLRRCEPVFHEGRAVSSTMVRNAIISGRLKEAVALLGRAPVICGKVVKGKGVGKEFGFPTANLALENQAMIPCGIYAGQTRLGGKPYLAAISIGTCPTLSERQSEPGRGPFVAGRHCVEVHLIGFEGDLVGKELAVAVTEKLREEERFPTLEALAAQIKEDVAQVQRLGFRSEAEIEALNRYGSRDAALL